MLELEVPGFGNLRLAHLVADFNGTLAVDGVLLPGVEGRLRELSRIVSVHVVTADTMGTAREQTAHLPVRVTVIPTAHQADAKLDFIRRLDCSQVAAVGNGRNDRKMLAEAALGIAVVQGEGAAAESTRGADVLVSGIVDALDLLLMPQRLVATLRA
jgi:soluble P-type ATPase